MKSNWSHLDKYRIEFSSPAGTTYGTFEIPHHGNVLVVIATDGEGTDWEHVSVRCEDPVFKKTKTPKWDEMCFIKSLFWEPTECVVQFHPAQADYISIHDHVLHLWRSTTQPFPMPPKICV